MNVVPLYRIKNLSENAVIVEFGQQISMPLYERVYALFHELQKNPFVGYIECVPSYHNLCIYFDPIIIHRDVKLPVNEHVAQAIEERIELPRFNIARYGRVIEIPVRYGGVYGPDLAYVAEYHGISEEDVIARHTSQELFVYMLGFAPGFAFLGGMDETIATPRREQPRLKIPAGSVGIGGGQTGVYPLVTPGGWQIIGRTDLPLFLPNEQIPVLLRAGDRVKFVAIND